MQRHPRPLPALAIVVLCALVPIAIGTNGCSGSGGDTPAAVRLTREPVQMEKLTYPPARCADQQDDYHGTVVSDPYRWLEDVDSAETRAWVAAQDELTYGWLAGIPQRETYRRRLTELWDYARYGTPFHEGGRTFYFKNDGLQDQSVLYVQDTPAAEPRVLLDPNGLSEDGTVALGEISVSKDGRLLAWSTSVSGSDWRTWTVRDIASGEDLPDRVEWSKFSEAAWHPDGSGFYYSRYDAPAAGETFEGANYFQKLYFHRLGTDQAADLLVYDRPDQKEWSFNAQVSDDGRYLLITIWQGTSQNNRLYYQDLRDAGSPVVPLLDEGDASYGFLYNEDEVFYLRTNFEAPRERIITIDTRRPERANWRTILAESEDPLDGVSVLDHRLVVVSMHHVANVVKVYGLDGRFEKEIALPGLGSAGGFLGRPGDTETYYSFNSYLNPNEVYHYDMASGRSTLFRAPEIAFDFSGYATEQVFYTSKDGTSIPMFLVHRKDLPLDGTNPTLLYGYGGFNVSLNPRFTISILPWIERGGIYAVANLRGGGEYGEAWHQGGMLKNKQNVFDDFIAAAETLIREGYTNPNRLAVMGGSNGGTLVGAVVNQRPELFGAAIAQVGVMDMLRFQKFTIGWAWTSDYGSSEDPDLFPVLRGYSPYHNLEPGVEYPAVLVTTADHDDRVVPGHSFKYAARLQACQAGNLPVLIRIQTKAGHGGGMPTSMVIQEVADHFAFLHRTLAMAGG